MPSISLDEEVDSLLKYTRKCDQRDAITSSRNKQADLRQARVAEGMIDAVEDSDDGMEITGSRRNVKVAKDSALGKSPVNPFHTTSVAELPIHAPGPLLCSHNSQAQINEKETDSNFPDVTRQ